jgi:hypothetical protein
MTFHDFKNLIIICSIIIVSLTSCSNTREAVSKSREIRVRDELNTIPASGSISYAWEEPMTQVIDVPPALDPDEVIYIPGHSEVIEVRPGRWQLDDNQ